MQMHVLRIYFVSLLTSITKQVTIHRKFALFCKIRGNCQETPPIYTNKQTIYMHVHVHMHIHVHVYEENFVV